jgi:hypothetical protein
MSSQLTKIRKSLAIGSVATLMASSMIGCNESSVIGESIVQDNVEVIIDSMYTVTGQSVKNEAVLSRTITQLIGIIDAPGYGRFSSDVVTQFMPAMALDTANVGASRIDSLKLVMNINLGAYTGDSIAPMGLDVYRLEKDLPTTIYSDFNPDGYYNPNKKIGSVIYNATALGEDEDTQELTYRQVTVDLPVELGQEIYNSYVADPSAFVSPTEFSQKVFKGLYFKNSYGSGRVTRVGQTLINMYYHSTYYDEDAQKDTTVNNVGYYFAVTPEIITNNNIKLQMDDKITDAVAAGENIVVAPTGLDVEFKFPAAEIISRYRANITSNLGVINSLSLNIPAEEIANEYDITLPENLLLILKSKKDDFFLNNEINDDETSFYATYSTTTNSYTFTGLKAYLVSLMDKGEITDDDITFVLTPVSVSTETTTSSYYSTGTTYVTAINPYMGQPAMAKLLLDEAKITFVYSKQFINN